MIEQPHSGRVPFALNAVLTLAFLLQNFVASYLFARERPVLGKAHISEFPPFQDHPALELIGALAAIGGAAIAFVWILQTVWNRVLTRHCNLQPLSFSAAYAISILLFAIGSLF